MKLFVPGRICLFGEHTDWAGGYRRMNPEVEKGHTIIAGTNQGLYAEVSPHPTALLFRSTLEDGTRMDLHEVPMEPDALLAEAQEGGFFSYAAGVAYQVMTHYRVRGLEIDNYATDLPIRKGLSSSAAVCVLLARAFNRVYDLKMTRRGEMEWAYRGEITTPSRCGRMDQGCAYGNRPITMTFDGDAIDIRELNVPKPLCFFIVDLKAGKDTKRILTDLNQCYPFPTDERQKSVHAFLGPISSRITAEAAEALAAGNSELLGRLMTEAQQEFDVHLRPACPSELTAPVLHQLLNYGPVQPYILGGKGVGSGGDGSAQLLARDAESRRKAIEIIERELGMDCLELTLGATRQVRKAVIPAAGFGTRMFPLTKAVKKELLPVIDAEGRAKPAILAIVEEALGAGLEEVGIIIQERDRGAFEELFYVPPAVEHLNRLSREDQEYCRYLDEVGNRVTFIIQDAQEGFGHAVYCSREWVGDEPFLLMLGDHLYRSHTEVSCARQVLDVYEKDGRSVLGLKPVPAAEVYRFGCAAGAWSEDREVLEVTEVSEKPTEDYARERLRVEGQKEDTFLSVAGLYVLTSKVFEYLEEDISRNLRQQGEFEFTPCLDRLRREEGLNGVVIDGERFDIGMPDSYRRAVVEFGAPTQRWKTAGRSTS